MAGQNLKKLVLKNGDEYEGTGFGWDAEKVFELVFNTDVVGYQEIVTDQSYTDLGIVMTYPLIGNTGITDEDYESRIATLGALIVREYNDFPSNFRSAKTLAELMEEDQIPGIEGIDTRKLTRCIRDNGTLRAVITDIKTPKEEALAKIKDTPVPQDGIKKVSCKKRWYSRTAGARFNVVAVDCGIKTGIIKSLNQRGCNVTVVPFDTSAAEIIKMRPSGILISNGPGDPKDAGQVVELIKALKGKYPILGISLGNLLIALAYGADTKKLACHKSGAHPVREAATGKINSATINYGYAVAEKSLEGTGLTVTYRDVLDNTVCGVSCDADKVFGVQFNPESAPGPQENAVIFDRFTAVMEDN